MADQENGAANPEAQPKSQELPAGPQMSVLTQFIRDMSFENILSQRGTGGEVTPDVQVAVNLDAKKRSVENQYEVVTKLVVTSQNKGTQDKLFL